jgi:hypothetical protein
MNLREYYYDITKTEAKKILSTKKKVKRIKNKYGFGYDYSIYYKRQWRKLMRVDLCNQCPTSTVLNNELTDKKILDYYKSLIMYGARIYDKGFAVIDSVTDG